RRRPLPFLLASPSHVERLLPAPSSLQTTQSRQPPPPPVLVQRRPCTRFKELTVRRKGDAKVRQLPRCHPGIVPLKTTSGSAFRQRRKED
uniref:Uncharacterized protein n=1 Tax=Aegilops tauschii subsp. strangulata TaxID=200361 RepID=A0A453BHK5_AEGTS